MCRDAVSGELEAEQRVDARQRGHVELRLALGVKRGDGVARCDLERLPRLAVPRDGARQVEALAHGAVQVVLGRRRDRHERLGSVEVALLQRLPRWQAHEVVPPFGPPKDDRRAGCALLHRLIARRNGGVGAPQAI